MTDYKRMVSYMYQYESGIKKKNVGYARVESKNGQCKVTLHMQLLGQLDSIFPVYLIQRDNGDMNLIYLGDSVLKSQIMDSKLTAEEVNIMGSGYNFSNIGGILLFLNEKTFYATEWDDKVIIAEEVSKAMRPKPVKTDLPKEVQTLPEAEKIDLKLYEDEDGKVPDLNEENGNFEETQILEEEQEENPLSAAGVEGSDSILEECLIPKYKLPRGWKTVEWLQNPKTLNMEPQKEVELTKAESNQSVKETIKMTVKQEEEVEKADPPMVVYFFENYPRIYPFEDNEITLCVKIEPKDIGYLSKEAWTLSNNSFLLHGYYSYQHLIFAKIKDRFGCRYLLGVPGIYHNRERFMARMFGFECFKSIRKRELRQGDFGYWYIPIIM